jgi:hypothetical protein
VAIFVKGWGWDLLALGTIDCIENDAPLGNVDRRVLEEVVEEDLGNVFILNKERQNNSIHH